MPGVYDSSEYSKDGKEVMTTLEELEEKARVLADIEDKKES
jgi:hypothetical protein